MRRTIFTLVMVIFQICLGNSQHFEVRQFQANQGYSFGNATAIAQDTLGFIWFSNRSHLIKFDGHDHQVYRGSSFEGIEYISTFPDGGLMFNANGQWTQIDSRIDTAYFHKLSSHHRLNSKESSLNKPFRDSRGAIWSKKASAVVKWDGDSLQTYQLTGRFALNEQVALRFTEDDFGRLWIMTDKGSLFGYNEQIDGFIEKNNFGVTDILYFKNIGNNKLRCFGSSQLEIEINPIGQVLAYKIKRIKKKITAPITTVTDHYFSTQNGEIFSWKFGELEATSIKRLYKRNISQNIEDLPIQKVNDLHETAEGELWVGTPEGIFFLEQPFFSSLEYLPYYAIRAMVRTRDNEFYISTGELFRYVYQNGELKKRDLKVDFSINQFGFVSSMAAGKEKLWVGNQLGELHYLNEKETSQVKLETNGGSIFYLFLDTQENLWVCQAPDKTPLIGLSKIGIDQKVEFYGKEKGIENRVLALDTLMDGTLFAAGVGVESYLYRFDRSRDHFENISVPLDIKNAYGFEVHDIVPVGHDEVWLGTTHGLFHYTLGNIERLEFPGKNQNIEIRAVEVTDSGIIWASTDTHGLICIVDNEMVFFDERSGLPTKIMNYRKLMTDHKGYLWVGTDQGAVISSFNNRQLTRTSTPKLVSILISEKNGDRNELLNQDEVTEKNNMLFNFQSNSYPKESLLFQTRILGLDDEWSFPTQENQLEVERMAVGNYQFQVRAMNKKGTTWSESFTYDFRVIPVWYNRPWMYLIYAITFLIAVMVGVRLYAYHLKVRNRTLERTIIKRTSKILSQQTIIESQNQKLLQTNNRLEEAVLRRTKELKIANDDLIVKKEELDLFIYRSAHDLRGPITTMMGLCSLGKKDPDKENLGLYLRMMSQTANKMNQTVLRLLRTHKIKKQKLSYESIRIKKMIDEIILEISKNRNVNHVDLRMTFPEDEEMLTDPFLMNIHLSNVLDNAFQFCDRQKEHSFVEVSTRHTSPKKIEIVVADNGQPVSQSMEDLSQMFFRGSGQSKGAGLGLYESKIIVERLAGEMRLDLLEDDQKAFVTSFPV